jgi:fermentation-respiration switch protein FrsA (DUF1100 family)
MYRKLIYLLIFTFFSISLSSCSHLFYQPDRYLYYAPEKFKLNPERIHFKSSDGTKLFAWYFKSKSKNRKGTFIQFHGNAENISSHYLTLTWILEHGWDLFTFDYRGYGKSEGTPTQKGTILDGIAALDHAYGLHQTSGGGKFVIYGQSLGGAIAMRSHLDFKNKDSTFLIVQDSTFSSYREIAKMKMKSFWLTWPLTPLSGLLISDKFASKKALKENKTRMLVIHDTQDPAVPFACGKEIFELTQSEKTFWKLNSGAHIGVFMPNFPENRKKFLNYLDTANPGQNI